MAIYVFALEGGRYYIGTTTDVVKSFQQHLDGKGPSWTQRFRPLRIELVTGRGTEEQYVKQYMKMYGINYVRGGSYQTDDISALEEKRLIQELWTPDTIYPKPLTQLVPEAASETVNLLRSGVSGVFGVVSDVFGAVRDVIKPADSQHSQDVHFDRT
jgi:predicted GIY-YIG superfamily endonuclease